MAAMSDRTGTINVRQMFFEWNGFDHKMISFSPSTSDHLVGRRKGAGCPRQQGPEGGHPGTQSHGHESGDALVPGAVPRLLRPRQSDISPYQKEKLGGLSLIIESCTEPFPPI